MNGGTAQNARILEASIEATRPFVDTFDAWTESGQRLDVSGAKTLTEAVDRVSVGRQHKDVFFIRVTFAHGGNFVVEGYTIQQESRASYRRDGATGKTVCFKQRKPVRLFSTPFSEFLPKEPWHWTPGCDVVGVNTTNPITPTKGQLP